MGRVEQLIITRYVPLPAHILGTMIHGGKDLKLRQLLKAWNARSIGRSILRFCEMGVPGGKIANILYRKLVLQNSHDISTPLIPPHDTQYTSGSLAATLVQ